MKDLKQIRTISKALEMEKEKRMAELMRINSYIQKKQDMVSKMLAYQREYFASNQLSLTKATPALFKNLNAFSKKIDDIVHTEEKEIQKLIEHRSNKLEELKKVEQKIKMMGIFEERIIAETNLKREVMEQINIDDLSSVKNSRGKS